MCCLIPILFTCNCLSLISRCAFDSGDRVTCIGTIIVGATGDEPLRIFEQSAAAGGDDPKTTMRDVLGVDLSSLAFNGKFVFVAQVGSPQKVVMELRDNSAPHAIDMDVLITGWLIKAMVQVLTYHSRISIFLVYSK